MLQTIKYATKQARNKVDGVLKRLLRADAERSIVMTVMCVCLSFSPHAYFKNHTA